MSFRCVISTEDNTSNNTEHTLCSTKCGHLFGKSCLERWVRRQNNPDKFKCPACCKGVLDNDCHLIYDVPDEVLKLHQMILMINARMKMM